MSAKRIFHLSLLLLIALIFLSGCSSTVVDTLRWVERTRAGLSVKSVDAGDHRIVYLEGGQGETILLLHGFGDRKDSWVRFARLLTKKYHVIIPDLPGFGDSDRIWEVKYDVDSQVARMHDFAQKLGLKKFHVAGNSMGGAIAGVYTVKHPEQILTLCLIDTAGIIDVNIQGIAKEIVRGFNPLIVKSKEDYQRRIDFVFVQKPSYSRFVEKHLLETAIANNAFNLKVFDELLPGDQLEPLLPKIKVPTLVIWGDTDRIFPPSFAKVIEQKVPTSRVVIMQDCGHLPMTERPQETATHYLSFLSSGG